MINYEFVKIIVSIFTGGLIAGLFSTYQSNKKIKLEVITNERQKWRDKMRHLTEKMVMANMYYNYNEMKAIYHQIKTRLNPLDEEDSALLDSVKHLFDEGKKGNSTCINSEGCEKIEGKDIDEFTTRMALLLKYDWERAKCESAPWWHFKLEPSRIKYDALIKSREIGVINSFFRFIKKCREALVDFLRWLIIIFVFVSVLLLLASLALISYKFLKGIWSAFG